MIVNLPNGEKVRLRGETAGFLGQDVPGDRAYVRYNADDERAEFAPVADYVESIAALEALNTAPLRHGEIVQVLGYYTVNDGGGGLFYYDASSTATANGGTIFEPDSGTGRWLRIYSGPINVRWFGAKGDGTTDDTAAIQAAIDACYEAGGNTAFVPVGVHVSGPLILKYKVSLAGATPQGNNLNVDRDVASVLKLKAGATDALISSDTVNGPAQGTSSIGVLANKHWQCSRVWGLSLDGNKSNQTSTAADLIKMTESWGFDVEECAFMEAKGFGLRILDCNAIRIFRNWGRDAGVYWEAPGDCSAGDNAWGGSNGIFNPVWWIAGATEKAWQNIFTGNFVFNNNYARTPYSRTFTVDTGTDELTASSAHNLSDGDPINLTTTGTLPSPLSAAATYYVKVISSTVLKLATTRKNLAAGTYVNLTSTGSGTHTLETGADCNIHLIGGSATTMWNLWVANRSDQARGHGFVLSGARNNLFTGNVVNFNGLGNATGQCGFDLRDSSTNNLLKSNNIDGEVYISGGYTSNQTIGVRCDATSVGNIIDNLTQNHPDGEIVLNTYTGNESVLISAMEMQVIGGGTALGTVGGGRRLAWLFDSAVDEFVALVPRLPLDWSRVNYYLQWVNAGAGAGDVYWVINSGQYAFGATLNAADAGGVVAVVTAGAQDVFTESLLGTETVSPGMDLFLRIKRTATEVTDTLGNDAGVIALRIEKANT